MTKRRIAKEYQSGAVTIFTNSSSKLDRKAADKLSYLILDALRFAETPTRLQVARELGIRRERLTRLITALGIETEFERIQYIKRNGV